MKSWAGLATKAGLAILLAAIAAMAALGGPEEAWLRVRWIWGGHPPPVIVSVEPDWEGPKGYFIATLRNPSWEAVAVTGYRADNTPNLDIGYATLNVVDDGSVTVMDAPEREPDGCSRFRVVALSRPLKIEPKEIRGLRFRPWREGCWFSVSFRSDHGDTASFYPFGFIDVEALDRELDKLRRRKPPTVQTCPDGAEVAATDSCPPPPPPPPKQSRVERESVLSN